MVADLGSITYTAVTWTIGDVITEAKLDSMVANDQAYDSHEAQGLVVANNKSLGARDVGDSAYWNLIKLSASDILTIGDAAITDYLSYLSPSVMKTTAWCNVYLTTDQLNLVDGTPTKVALASERSDRGGNFASNAFTTPVAGTYIITGSVTFKGITVDKDYVAAIYVDGAPEGEQRAQGSVVARVSANVCIIREIAINKTIELYATSNSGNNTADIDGTEERTFLHVHLLSK